MRKPIFAKTRRKLADFILGGQTVLFVNSEQADLLKRLDYLAIDDETLGLIYRRNWAIIAKHFADQGLDEDRPFRSVMGSGCVLYLASEAAKANAEQADFIVTGSIDGGRTSGKWGVHVEQLPDDYPDVPDEIVRTDDGRITKLGVSFKNPGYRQWLMERQAARNSHDPS